MKAFLLAILFCLIIGGMAHAQSSVRTEADVTPNIGSRSTNLTEKVDKPKNGIDKPNAVKKTHNVKDGRKISAASTDAETEVRPSVTVSDPSLYQRKSNTQP